MKRVILESPYAGDIERNVVYARAALRDTVLRGESALPSHLLWTQDGVLDDGNPGERALGIAAGHAWAEVAEAFVFYIDHGMSPGMTAALAKCESEGIPFEKRRLPKRKMRSGERRWD